jgi:predicted amidophosphoribosyltransferase
MVHEVKFTRWRRLGRDLGDVLGRTLATAIERERAIRPGFAEQVVIIPVPTTLRRRVVRGIDHSCVIAAAAAKPLRARLRPGVIRRKHRPSQLLVLPSDRAANVAGAFLPGWRAAGGRALEGRLVVVVDDVTTTGATLKGACRAVRRAYRRSGGKRALEVWVAVIAVTELERSRSEKPVKANHPASGDD